MALQPLCDKTKYTNCGIGRLTSNAKRCERSEHPKGQLARVRLPHLEYCKGLGMSTQGLHALASKPGCYLSYCPRRWSKASQWGKARSGERSEPQQRAKRANSAKRKACDAVASSQRRAKRATRGAQPRQREAQRLRRRRKLAEASAASIRRGRSPEIAKRKVNGETEFRSF